MWYVIQVPTGREEQIIEETRNYGIQPYYEELFTPRCERKRKYLGEWHLESETLFPGYIFAITLQPEELYQSLKRIPRLTRLVGTGEKWTSMSPDDIHLVELLTGAERIVRFSEGYMKEGKVTVTNGPLQGLEDKICRVDRHKRLAWLKVKLIEREVEVMAGLEIVRKE